MTAPGEPKRQSIAHAEASVTAWESGAADLVLRVRQELKRAYEQSVSLPGVIRGRP
jgi:hypothetical protein